MTRPSIKLVEELRVVTLPSGVRAAVIDVAVPDDAPVEVKEGLARRRLVNEGRTCPCGARLVLPNRAARRRGALTPVSIEHEGDCPAITDRLIIAIRQASSG